MHVVQEQFHTITMRRWEAAEVVTSFALLCKERGVDLTDYPPLVTLYNGFVAIAQTDAPIACVIDDTDGPTPDSNPPEART